MTATLPPNLLRLFTPRPPVPFAPPVDREFNHRKGPFYSDVASFVHCLSEPSIPSTSKPTPQQLKQEKVNVLINLC